VDGLDRADQADDRERQAFEEIVGLASTLGWNYDRGFGMEAAMAREGVPARGEAEFKENVFVRK
jgi:hypothetical protein